MFLYIDQKTWNYIIVSHLHIQTFINPNSEPISHQFIIVQDYTNQCACTHTFIYAGNSQGLNRRKLCESHLWEGVLAYIKSVCVFALKFARVHVCMYVQASQTASWYFIVINNRCVCLWQFTQSVCLSHRPTPCCYCLAQRLTQRATLSKNDTSAEMTLLIEEE